MPPYFDHYSTVCCGCSKIVGRHWVREHRHHADEGGKEGVSVSDKQPCPYCGGGKFAGFRGDHPIGTDVSDTIKMSKCRRCGVAFKITSRDGGKVLHEDGKSKNRQCGECHVATYLEQHPDPSDGSQRFRVDNIEIKWVLARVKVVCPDCKKDRWLAPDNAFKVRCEKCYQAQAGRLKPARSRTASGGQAPT